ncbi:hypothetical protein GW17_00014683 [Ensete ventricosum]|uniref:Uncharacterized protein n=1 Tax=Ensete ventricosum TaxID=4639 RepID=A0A444FEV7_ENSVE|nr:hypothetical protein B296_00055355 [Ensete ventricosum]RWW21175.1 hypothetical protein GW17_00014683 [Ensete ventricosum]
MCNVVCEEPPYPPPSTRTLLSPFLAKKRSSLPTPLPLPRRSKNENPMALLMGPSSTTSLASSRCEEGMDGGGVTAHSRATG